MKLLHLDTRYFRSIDSPSRPRACAYSERGPRNFSSDNFPKCSRPWNRSLRDRYVFVKRVMIPRETSFSKWVFFPSSPPLLFFTYAFLFTQLHWYLRSLLCPSSLQCIIIHYCDCGAFGTTEGFSLFFLPILRSTSGPRAKDCRCLSRFSWTRSSEGRHSSNRLIRSRFPLFSSTVLALLERALHNFHLDGFGRLHSLNNSTKLNSVLLPVESLHGERFRPIPCSDYLR